jgi:F-type H+-transporting ATPase subunit epsilon
LTMGGSIELQIVTPDGVQLNETVDDLTAPSVNGEFGVLPGHRPLLAALRTGIVSYGREGKRVAVAVGPGFAKVADDQAVLLTDKFIRKEDVDAVVARKDLKEADQALSALGAEPFKEGEEHELAELVARLRWAAARLELYGDPPPPTIVMGHEMKLLGHEDYSQTLATSDRPETHGEHEGAVKAD